MRNARTLFVACVTLLMTAGTAMATSCPAFYYGKILTPAEWQACFNAKQDALGYTPVNRAGDSMAGKLNITASTTSAAGIVLAPGTAPTTPAAGAMWTTSTGGFFGYINSQTVWLSQPSARMIASATVDFNATGDTEIPITLPPGFTRYLVKAVRITGADHDLTTATAGVFTAASGGGVTVVTGASAISVSSSADATNNNAQSMTVIDADTRSYTVATQPSLFFDIGTAEGAAATGTVIIEYAPVP